MRGILNQHGVVLQVGIAVANCIGEAKHPSERGDIVCRLDAVTFQESRDSRDGPFFDFRILRSGGYAECLGEIFLVNAGYGKLPIL